MKFLKSIPLTVLTFLVGVLILGGALGAYGYFQLSDLQLENTRLQGTVKKQKKRISSLRKSQSELKAEFKAYKEQSAKDEAEAQGALKVMKDTANIEALYAIGLRGLKSKDYTLAYLALSEVQKHQPQYKELDKHFPAAQKAYQQKKKDDFQAKLKATYLKAFDHQGKQQLAQAKEAYQQVIGMQANYKDAQKRLDMVSKQLALRTQKSDAQQLQNWLASQYKLGTEHQQQGRFVQAKGVYEEIIKYAPKYKDTPKRLIAVIAQIPPSSKLPVPGQAKSQNQICYDKGVEYGKCYTLVHQGKKCTRFDLSQPPAACQNNPEFKKGFKTTAPTDATIILRGLSNFLKNM